MKVLIAGGTGLLGDAISKALLEAGHRIGVLTRGNSKMKNGIHYHQWHPSKAEIDPELVKKYDAVINLAGFPVNSRWTESNRKLILDSRVQSSVLLTEELNKAESTVRIYIQASAIGYYKNGSELRMEDDPPGDDFLSEVCVAWEKSSENLNESKVRKVINRIGVVLSTDGGALQKMLPVFKLGLGSPLGSGEQFMSFIHIDDLAALFIYQLENSISGTYNAVAPNPVTNREFSKVLAKSLGKPFFMPSVPAFALKMIMGESASIALKGQHVSSKKVKNSGFQFQFPQLPKALSDLLK